MSSIEENNEQEGLLGSVDIPQEGESIATQHPNQFLPKGYEDLSEIKNSKGYTKFLQSFPSNKQRDSEQSWEIWSKLSQEEKQKLFKHLKSTISKFKLQGKEQYLKNSEKYLEAGEWNIDFTKPLKLNPSKYGMSSYGFMRFYEKATGLDKLFPRWGFDKIMEDFHKGYTQEEQEEWREIYMEIEEERLKHLNEQ